jgi:type II secretory pathway pseudopilin PulG
VLACLGIGGLFATLLIPAATETRTAAKKTMSTNNLKQIMLAMHNYHDTNGHWPPAYVEDENGKPLYSWRVLLLPYLDQAALYNSFDKTKAWDDPANIAISQTSLSVFRSPEDEFLPAEGTNYFVLLAPNTVFTGKDATRMADITDGTSNTIGVIELKGIPGSWAAPIDPQLSAVNPVLAPGQLTPVFPNGTHAGFCDGSVRFLPVNLQPNLLQALLIRNDGQAVPYDF